jgi:M6 family metalloprotease-like protein
MKGIQKLILIVIFFQFFFVSGYGAYIKNRPAVIKQPDGTMIKCFVSGDEFYRRVSDTLNRTIIQDPETGYWVYALLVNDVLVPSSYVVGKTEPFKIGIPAGLNISSNKILSIRKQKLNSLKPKPALEGFKATAENTGLLNNIVVFVRFLDDPEFSDAVSVYQKLFNAVSSSPSLQGYYKEVSFNTLNISSTFYPLSGPTIISYKDFYKRSYYQPYNQTTNPGGYKTETESNNREQTLISNIVSNTSSNVPSTLNLDFNNDGYVDNICFIVKGTNDTWNDLLWPHRWSLYQYNVKINGKTVYDYNFQLEDFILPNNVGVLCHEMFHTLGAPDLYHYDTNYEYLEPLGKWDIMENDSQIPQSMCTYMKYRYGKWISNLPVITQPGQYSVKPISSSSNNVLKILSKGSAEEYFVLEYRDKTGSYESSLPGSGLLIYRINSAFDGKGNSDYNGSSILDELYVFRPGGSVSVNGDVASAPFNQLYNRTVFTEYSDPACFLSDGTPEGIDISNINVSDTLVTFRINNVAVPYANTSQTSNISAYSCTLNGTYNTLGIQSTFYFQYGTTKSVDHSTPATIDALNNRLNANVTLLLANTTYYFKIKMQNTLGVFYSTIDSFTTLCPVFNLHSPYGIDKPCSSSGSFTYASSYTNASSYSWSLSPTNVGSIEKTENNRVQVLWDDGFLGAASLKVKVVAGNCESDYSPSLNISVVQPLTKAPLPSELVYKGSNILISPDSGKYSYQWYHNCQPISSANGQYYVIPDTAKTGMYYSATANSDECSVQSSIYNFQKSAPPIFRVNKASAFSLFPNPGSGIFHIQLNDMTAGSYRLQLFDSGGRLILQRNIYIDSLYEIDLSGFTSGIYYVRLSGDNIEEGSPLIIK